MNDIKQQLLKIKYNGNVSQYGWVCDGKVIQCDYNGCHSQILSYPTTPTQAFSFGPNIPNIRLQYIFDEAVSPWRKLVPTLGVTIEELKAGAPFIYNDLSIDANLIVNHMVSVRWPAEQINSYALWERLLLKGVHPAVADLLTGLCATRWDQKYGEYDPEHPRFTTYQYMHSNFIALDCTMEYAENFVHGKMTGGNGNPFNQTKTAGCANDYTKSSKARGYKPIIGAFAQFEQLSFIDTLKGVRGEYMKFLEDTYGVLKDFNHLVEIGYAEQKRFGLPDWGPGKQHAARGVHETPNGVELRQDAIYAYEAKRDGQSDWGYVQGKHQHKF